MDNQLSSGTWAFLFFLCLAHSPGSLGIVVVSRQGADVSGKCVARQNASSLLGSVAILASVGGG